MGASGSSSPSPSPVAPIPRRAGASGGDANAARGHRLGRYLLTGRLGEGGMGVVYEAEDTLLQRRVAIKLLPKEVSANPEALRRFLREARAAAKLNHPNVVAVYDVGESDGTHFIVMERIQGGNAQEQLRSHGPFPWREATSILIAVCRGVAAAHQAGLIHRDIKPANILRSADGGVKLADFGLVKPAGRKGTVVTALGALVGTPHYMSPEQGQSSAVDARSDIYSLGATYFALLTGRPPYLAADPVQILFAHCSLPIPDPRQFVATIPEGCTAILRKAMAKQRAQRHACAVDLLTELEAILTSPTATASTGAAVAPAPPPNVTWSESNSLNRAHSLSFADAYPGERTEGLLGKARPTWKPLGFTLLALVGLCVALGILWVGANRRGVDQALLPIIQEKDDWPSLSVAADRAIRQRNALALKTVAERLAVFRKRVSGGPPAEHEEIERTLIRLEKARAYRESITEKGLAFHLTGLVTSVAFSPNDQWLAAGQGSGDTGAYLLDSYTGEKRFSLWPQRTNLFVKVHAIAFTHDSSALAAACGETASIKLWRVADGKESTLAVGAGVKRALALASSPTSKHLVAGFEPNIEGRGRTYLKIWNHDTAKEPFVFKAEHTARIRAVAFCSGGEQIATGGQDQRVILWNAESGRIWRELHTGLSIQAIVCAPQGRVLAVAGQDKGVDSLQLWDAVAERRIAAQPSPHGACRCLAFSGDGRFLASGSGSKIMLWNSETLDLWGTLEGHGQDVTSLAFAAQGGILASGSADQTMRLWDVTRFLTAP